MEDQAFKQTIEMEDQAFKQTIEMEDPAFKQTIEMEDQAQKQHKVEEQLRKTKQMENQALNFN